MNEPSYQDCTKVAKRVIDLLSEKEVRDNLFTTYVEEMMESPARFKELKSASTTSFSEDECICLYDESGEHKLTILHCVEDSFDLCLPSGKVLYCGVPADLVEVLTENMIVGEISAQKRTCT